MTSSGLDAATPTLCRLSQAECQFLDKLDNHDLAKWEAPAYIRIGNLIKEGRLPVIDRSKYKVMKDMPKPQAKRLETVEGPLTILGVFFGCLGIYLAAIRQYKWAAVSGVVCGLCFFGAWKAGSTADMKKIDDKLAKWRDKYKYFVYIDDLDQKKVTRLYRTCGWQTKPEKNMGRAQPQARCLDLLGKSREWDLLLGRNSTHEKRRSYRKMFKERDNAASSASSQAIHSAMGWGDRRVPDASISAL